MNKKYFASGIICLIIIAFVTALNKNAPEVLEKTSSRKIQVMASFYPLYFFTSQIAGDKADVTNITPAGVEPHDYEPTAQDMVRIENSDVLVLNGAHLEAWAGSLKNNLESTLVMTMIEDEERVTDPHIWLSPVLAEKMVDRIAGALKEVDSANAMYYEANAKTLKAKLSDLDREFSQSLSSCSKKDIVTSHAAFGYLAAEYDLNQVPIAGLSPEAEPSPKELAEIAKFARESGIEYIFFEDFVSPKLAQTIAKEIGAKTLVLNPLEGLSEDDVIEGKDYFTEMRDNLSNLRIALQCTR